MPCDIQDGLTYLVKLFPSDIGRFSTVSTSHGPVSSQKILIGVSQPFVILETAWMNAGRHDDA